MGSSFVVDDGVYAHGHSLTRSVGPLGSAPYVIVVGNHATVRGPSGRSVGRSELVARRKLSLAQLQPRRAGYHSKSIFFRPAKTSRMPPALTVLHSLCFLHHDGKEHGDTVGAVWRSPIRWDGPAGRTAFGGPIFRVPKMTGAIPAKQTAPPPRTGPLLSEKRSDK